MKIVIVGAGKVGVALTRHLAVENRVTVIDQNPHLVENIINIYDAVSYTHLTLPTILRV